MVIFEPAEELRARAILNKKDPGVNEKALELKKKIENAASNGQFWIRPNTTLPPVLIDELKQLGYKVNIDRGSGIVHSISWNGFKKS